jgi:hypothetical protein
MILQLTVGFPDQHTAAPDPGFFVPVTRVKRK